MKNWFDQLKQQEQIMVVAGVACLVLYLVLYVGLGSRADKREQMEQANERARETLMNVAELAARYKQSGGNGAATQPQMTLSQLVNTTVPRYQLSMKRFQPSSNGDASVRFESVSFNQILAWLNDVESSRAVVVKDISVTPGNGSGLVNISVRLRPGV